MRRGSDRRSPSHKTRRRLRAGRDPRRPAAVPPRPDRARAASRLGRTRRCRGRVGAGTALEPAAADHRPGDPRAVRDRGRNVAEQRRRVGVARMWHDLDAAVALSSTEKAPQCELCGRRVLTKKQAYPSGSRVGVALSCTDRPPMSPLWGYGPISDEELGWRRNRHGGADIVRRLRCGWRGRLWNGPAR